MGVIVHCDSFEQELGIGPDISDVTGKMECVVRASAIQNGSLQATAIGSTGSLTTIEHEPGVVQDLIQAIIMLAPPGRKYAHELAWHDGNGHSHVQAALLGPSITLPVRDGTLLLGTWQQVVLINHDNKARKRRVHVTVIGNE